MISTDDVEQAKEAGEKEQTFAILTVKAWLVGNIPEMMSETKGAVRHAFVFVVLLEKAALKICFSIRFSVIVHLRFV